MGFVLGSFWGGFCEFKKSFQKLLLCTCIVCRYRYSIGVVTALRSETKTRIQKEFKMTRFAVNIVVNGKRVKTENIQTLPELKSFLYGLMETKGVFAGVFDRQDGYAMLVQESGKAIRKSSIKGCEKFFTRLKKSSYA